VITGEWRILENEEHYDLYPSPNIIREVDKNELGEECGTYGGEVPSCFRWGNVR